MMKPKARYTPAQYSLRTSFFWAVSGVVHALKHERNLRIHFAVAAYVLYFARYYDFSRLEYCVIILFIGAVITCEMINTAIETTVDLETSGFSRLAKTAKDVAAGAVLVSSIFSVAAGAMLFWDVEILAIIWRDALDHIVIWLLLACATLLWIIMPKRKG